jgi:hypothetical protein
MLDIDTVEKQWGHTVICEGNRWCRDMVTAALVRRGEDGPHHGEVNRLIWVASLLPGEQQLQAVAPRWRITKMPGQSRCSRGRGPVDTLRYGQGRARTASWARSQSGRQGVISA